MHRATEVLVKSEDPVLVLGKKVSFTRAEEPSVYIWENMAFTNNQRRIRSLLVFVVLALIMFPAQQLQFLMQETVLNHESYEQIDCKVYHDSIGDQIYNIDIGNVNLREELKT